MVIESSLQKLRLKYYWQGVTMYDVVSLVGIENIIHAEFAMKKPANAYTGKFYHVTRVSITNGSIKYSTTPIIESCPRKYFRINQLDNRCVVISGDINQFKAMLITDNAGIPTVLGRESFAIRFKTPEDAISAHAWFLSDEVSIAIRATLREKSMASNNNRVRITMDEVMSLPVPSIEWLNHNYSNGKLKAKCIGLGSHIMSSLQGANLNDPMYSNIVEVLETAVKKLGGLDDSVAKSNYIF